MRFSGGWKRHAVCLAILLLTSSQLQMAAGDAVLSFGSTPSTTPASTSFATTSTTTSTPASTPAATPAATETPTPAATVASTPAATVAATPAATVAATPAATTAATPAATVASTPAATTASTPAATPAAITVTATPAATVKATPTATTKATPAATPAATTPTPTPTTTPTPTNTSAPTPQATVAAPPPPPLNPNATALTATLQMSGYNLWPFSHASATALVNSLSQVLTTVTISGINVVNVTQVTDSSRRRARMLLGANDTVAAVLELEGTSSAAALSINSDLGNNVLNGNLQKTLARNGLVVQSLAMTYSNSAVPVANLACSSGSYEGKCTANLDGGFSTGKIIAIAAGGGAGALALIALAVICTLKCVNKKATAKARAGKPSKVMTPQHAQPFWEQDQKQAQGGLQGVNVEFGIAENPGYTYAETKEMGGRQARDQLKMKLPEFTARTSKIGKTSSGMQNISRTTSAAGAGVSRTNSNVATSSVSRTTSHATCIVHDP